MSTGVSFLLSGNAHVASACLLRQRDPTRLRHHVPLRVSCHQEGNDRQGVQPRLDRRDLLIGLGGLYGAAAGPMALANPIKLPDLTKCQRSDNDANRECCPPYTGGEIVDYDFPRTPLRVRRPAHKVIADEDFMRKYKLAVKKMKALPDDDPWNYYQQANVHCQFCNSAFMQGDTDAPIKVHDSWIFLPWHRFYLHFYERILGRLIDDDTFTLPYWNFDTPEGMSFPRIFEEASSPLYNPRRDKEHVQEGKILDYKYTYNTPSGSGSEGQQLIQDNLDYMRKTFQQGLPLPELFMGDPLRAEEKTVKGMTGQLEVMHNTVHMWVGQAKSNECCPSNASSDCNADPSKCHIDMGNFSTAARDSVFFCLHANVDRLWDIYRSLRGNRLEFDDADWLQSEFLFTDENRRLVKVKIQDSLEPSKFCYTYEQVPLPWLGRKYAKKVETADKDQVSLTRVREFPGKPLKLDANTPLRVLVARPKKNRKKSEKQEAVEVLQIDEIDVSLSASCRFDVYITTPYNGSLVGPALGEFAGSFVRLAHSMKGMPKGLMNKAKLKLGLTGLLEDIEADDAEKLVVTLVLRDGDVSVGGINVKLIETESAGFF